MAFSYLHGRMGLGRLGKKRLRIHLVNAIVALFGPSSLNSNKGPGHC